VVRRDCGDGDLRILDALPPWQFDNSAESEVSDNICDVLRYDDLWSMASSTTGAARYSTQRRPMKMVEVSMGDHYVIDSRKVAERQPRTPETFQQEQPARKVWVDEYVLAPDLKKKRRVPDERYSELIGSHESGQVRRTAAPLHRRLSYQLAELPRLTSKSDI
jgi:hypothetical protein